jgi:hypothetical protein
MKERDGCAEGRGARQSARLIRFGLAVGCGLALVACRHDPNTGELAASSTTASPAPTSPPPTKARAPLPVDPAPPLAAKALEGPALEAEAVGDAVYQKAWDGKHDAARDILLTALSHGLISEQDDGNMILTQAELDALKREKLDHAFLKLASYIARTGNLPSDVIARAKMVLSASGGLPFGGTWRGTRGKPPPEADFAALAYWLNPSDADRLRVFIATRPIGNGWQSSKRPMRPYLARERFALRRLGLLTALTSAEQARLEDLDESARSLGDEPPEVVDLREMLHEYASNEVRADDRYKGHVVQFSGVAGSLQRGHIGGITLTVGTGAAFERPEVHCSFDDRQTARVKSLNKGDHVSVRGIVNGLAVDILIDHCEVAE